MAELPFIESNLICSLYTPSLMLNITGQLIPEIFKAFATEVKSGKSGFVPPTVYVPHKLG